MKKTISVLAIAVLLVGMLSVNAFAHGHCGGGWARGQAYAQPQYQHCTVEGCELAGLHQHDGTWYCSQLGVGCASYTFCAVEGCAELGIHGHDGIYYYRCGNYGAWRGTWR